LERHFVSVDNGSYHTRNIVVSTAVCRNIVGLTALWNSECELCSSSCRCQCFFYVKGVLVNIVLSIRCLVHSSLVSKSMSMVRLSYVVNFGSVQLFGVAVIVRFVPVNLRSSISMHHLYYNAYASYLLLAAYVSYLLYR
jgi:hypothetical protein